MRFAFLISSRTEESPPALDMKKERRNPKQYTSLKDEYKNINTVIEKKSTVEPPCKIIILRQHRNPNVALRHVNDGHP